MQSSCPLLMAIIRAIFLSPEKLKKVTLFFIREALLTLFNEMKKKRKNRANSLKNFKVQLVLKLKCTHM